MSNKVLSLILIFSLAFNIAFVGIWVYHRTRPQRPTGVAPRASHAPWEGLNLDPEQRSRLTEQRRMLSEQVRAARADLERARARLFELLEAPQIDEQAVRRAHERIEQAQQRVQRLVVEHMRGMRDVLGPEQHRRMMRMMRQYARRHGHASGRGRGGRSMMRGPMRGPAHGPEAPRGPRREPVQKP